MVSLCCLSVLQLREILFVNNPGWEFSLCNKKVNSSISSRLCPFDSKFHKDSDYHALHSYIHYIVNSLVFSKLLFCSSVWAETHYGFLVWVNTTKKNMYLHPHIFVRSLKPDWKCTTATLGIGTAYIYHSVGRLQVSARLPSEAKGCGIVSQTSFSLSLI